MVIYRSVNNDSLIILHMGQLPEHIMNRMTRTVIFSTIIMMYTERSHNQTLEEGSIYSTHSNQTIQEIEQSRDRESVTPNTTITTYNPPPLHTPIRTSPTCHSTQRNLLYMDTAEPSIQGHSGTCTVRTQCAGSS